MGKYMRKSKSAGEVALMEVAQSSLGVRTRARTLALQRLQKSAAAVAAATAASTPATGGSYLQLRSRRLAKPPIFTRDSKRQKHSPKHTFVSNSSANPNPKNSRTKSGSRMGNMNSRSTGSVSFDCLDKEKGVHLQTEKLEVNEEIQEKDNGDVGLEASFGENMLEFEGKERSTRESTPCSLIRDPESIRTPGSTSRPTNSMEASRRVPNSMRTHIPTTEEMDLFFVEAEREQQRRFIEKYNFDPVNDKPLPGRFQWVKLDP